MFELFDSWTKDGPKEEIRPRIIKRKEKYYMELYEHKRSKKEVALTILAFMAGIVLYTFLPGAYPIALLMTLLLINL